MKKTRKESKERRGLEGLYYEGDVNLDDVYLWGGDEELDEAACDARCGEDEALLEMIHSLAHKLPLSTHRSAGQAHNPVEDTKLFIL